MNRLEKAAMIAAMGVVRVGMLAMETIADIAADREEKGRESPLDGDALLAHLRRRYHLGEEGCFDAVAACVASPGDTDMARHHPWTLAEALVLQEMGRDEALPTPMRTFAVTGFTHYCRRRYAAEEAELH